MSITAAARKVNISQCSGYKYYNEYKNDPEKKIPLSRNPCMHPRKYCAQEQIGNLIKYVDDDKMTVTEASAKANMPCYSARYYYNRYLEDPNHNIPVPKTQQSYTQDQKNEFIDYIVRDKMSILAASKKAKMRITTAQRYYHKYFKVQNPGIATPSHIITPKCYTQEQIKQVVSYIVDDKMSMAAASRKANFSHMSAGKYYRKHLKDSNMEAPVSKMSNRCTQDQIDKCIGYIVDNKMTIKAASKKANIHYYSGRNYYRQYLKDHHLDYFIENLITQKQKSELIGYIVDNNMSIRAASRKANMKYSTGHYYYRQYLKDHNLDVPIPKRYTQEQKSVLIGYIVDNKMTVKAASKKAHMSGSTGHKYYHQYLKDLKSNGPT
jgi:transposase